MKHKNTSIPGAVTTVRLTELIESPADTVALVRRGVALPVSRPGADDGDLLLTTTADAEFQLTHLREAHALLAELLDACGDAALSLLPRALPWARHLPPHELPVMLNELRAALASAVEDPGAVPQLLIEWRHTAEVYADPELLAALTGPFDDSADYGPVPCPGDDLG